MVIVNEELNSLQQRKQNLIKHQDSLEGQEKFEMQEEIDKTQARIELITSAILKEEFASSEPPSETKLLKDRKEYYRYLIETYRFHLDRMMTFRAEKKRVRELF